MAKNPFELKDTFEHKRNTIIKPFDVNTCEFVECSYDRMKDVKVFYPGRIYYAKDKKEFYIDLASSRIKLTSTLTIKETADCATKDQVSALDKRLKALETKPAPETSTGVSEEFVVNKISEILENGGNDYIDRNELIAAIQATFSDEICELHNLMSEFMDQIANNNDQANANANDIVAIKNRIEELAALFGDGSSDIDLAEFLELYLSKAEAEETYAKLADIETRLNAAETAAATAEQNAKDYAESLASNYDEKGAAAKAYADAKVYVNEEIVAAKDYALEKANDAKNSAKDYADTKDAETLAAAKAYADSVAGSDGTAAAAQALADAKEYVDGLVLNSDKTPKFDAAGTAKTEAEAALEAAKLYADQHGAGDGSASAAKALEDAKEYADSLVFNSDKTPKFEEKGAAAGALDAANAYADSLASNYDKAGDAAQALEDAKDYAYDLVYTNNVLKFDEAGAASDALDAAKAYAENLVANSDAAGSAAQAEQNAKDYAEGLASNYDAVGAAAAVQGNTDETVESLAGKLETLNGDGDGSIKQAVAEGIADVVAGADSDFDTLKEIADWIMNDTTGSAELSNKVNDHDSRLEALEGADSDFDNRLDALEDANTGLSDKLDELTSADSDFDERINALEGEDAKLAERIENIESVLEALGGSDVDVEGNIKIDDTYTSFDALKAACDGSEDVKDGIYVVTEGDKQVAYVVKNNEILVNQNTVQEWIEI